MSTREERLPVWAKQELHVLRQNLEQAKQALAAGAGRPVDNFLDLEGTEPFTLYGKSTGYRYLPYGDDVRASWLVEERPFRPARIEVRREGAGLYVASDGGGLIVRPHVTNVVRLEVAE